MFTIFNFCRLLRIIATAGIWYLHRKGGLEGRIRTAACPSLLTCYEYNTYTVNNMAMVKNLEEHMERQHYDLKSTTYNENQYRDLLVEFFEEDGWRVERKLMAADKGADLAISRGDLSYIRCVEGFLGRSTRPIGSTLIPGDSRGQGSCLGITSTRPLRWQ